MRKISKYFLGSILIFISLFSLTSCQSTNEKEGYLVFKNENVEYEYNTATNQTEVTWSGALCNSTIYKMNGFQIEFRLYRDAELLNTHTYHYSKCVDYGEVYTGRFTFSVDDKINNIELVKWEANYNTLWETYQVWFITTIVIVSFLVIAYIIVMIVEDLDLDDVFDFIKEHYTFIILLVVPFGWIVYLFTIGSWVPGLLILGGFFSVIILLLIAHLIKDII